MMWSRRQLKAENGRLRAEREEAIDERDDARRELDTARQVQRFQIDQRAQAEAGARRVQERNQALRAENADLREQVAVLQSRSALVALDGEYEDLYGRLCRALRGCARYRGQLADRARYAAGLQRQLDAALGMDDPGIAMGADWQHRRPDLNRKAA